MKTDYFSHLYFLISLCGILMLCQKPLFCFKLKINTNHRSCRDLIQDFQLNIGSYLLWIIINVLSRVTYFVTCCFSTWKVYLLEECLFIDKSSIFSGTTTKRSKLAKQDKHFRETFSQISPEEQNWKMQTELSAIKRRCTLHRATDSLSF